jgi:uncharacterized protein (TIGR03083 family)
MELTRPQILTGVVQEYRDFASLVETIDDAGWSAPTRCAGFEVRDVAGHVIGLAEDVAAGKPGSRNAEEEAASVRNDPPAIASKRLAAALDQIEALAVAFDDDAAWAGPSGVPDLTLGHGVLTLWYDAYVHADDIRSALDRPSERGPGLPAALGYLEVELGGRGWGPARIAFDDPACTDLVIGDAAGEPTHVDALAFVLAATGRLDAEPLGLDPAVNIYAE